MFTRHLFAAAALMAATLSAQAGAITSTPEALGTTTAASTSLASNMSIVDASASLSGTGLASILASSDSDQQFALVKGVEGLYMLAARINAPLDAGAGGTGGASAGAGGSTGVASPADAGPAAPEADPAAVPEPSSIALMLAGVLGAAGFTRGRKQG